MVKTQYSDEDKVQALIRIQRDLFPPYFNPTTDDLRKHYQSKWVDRLGIVNAVAATDIKKPDASTVLLGINGTDSYRIGKGHKDDLLDGEKLFLAIDLTQPKAKLLEAIERHIDFYGKMVSKPKVKTKKPTTIDPWTVYDLHHYEGLSASEIARRLSGETGTPSNYYNKKLDQVHKNVLRALERAQQVIEAVKKLTEK
jgi:hypothetical protein